MLFIDYDLMMHAVLAIVLAEGEDRISIQAGRDEPSRYLDFFCSYVQVNNACLFQTMRTAVLISMTIDQAIQE